MNKDQEKIIRDIVTANKEIIGRLNLQNQALLSWLPDELPGRPARGYIDMPDGKRLWWDKKAEKRYLRAKSKITVREGGKNG